VKLKIRLSELDHHTLNMHMLKNQFFTDVKHNDTAIIYAEFNSIPEVVGYAIAHGVTHHHNDLAYSYYKLEPDQAITINLL